MKSRLLMVGVLICIFFLAACQAGNNSGSDKGYPVPSVNEEVIPTRTARPTAPPGAAMYPEIASDTSINWFQAEAMILNAEVAKIVIHQDASFQIMLKDGRIFNSLQPFSDSVMQTIEKCADMCSDVEIVQE